MKIIKSILLIMLGFLLRMTLTELGNISYEHRWGECVVKMHQGIYPKTHPNGGHYCLVYMDNYTLFEKTTLYSPDLYKVYEEKVVMPKLEKAYKESQEGKNDTSK